MKRLFALLIVFLVFTSNVGAQDPIADLNREYLKGLGAVSVMVTGYRGESEQTRRLTTEIELRLRQVAIKVKQGPPVLMLGRQQAEVQEYGFFPRDDGVRELPATTWESRNLPQLPTNADWPSVRRSIMVAVDEFINDYLVANTPEQD